jgi:outer membrane protein OmpA-like peptidoglycan-associated protein
MRRLIESCLIASSIGFVPPTAHAADPPPAAVTADEIAAQLFVISPRARSGPVEEEWDRPEITCTPIASRGIYHDEGEEIVRRPRVQLEVNFPFGSDELLGDAASLVDELALAINGPMLEDTRFLIVGHTDAIGTEEDNRDLAERRARAVYDRLVRIHDVDPDRLRPRGCGEAVLLEPSDPNSARNRRVEVVNAGS